MYKDLCLQKKELEQQKLVKRANGIIPIMYEYAEPYRDFENICPTIPIPINLDKIEYQENKIDSKLIVFHGLNRRGSKGTEYIEKAFEILRKKYPNDLELVIVGNMKYKDYLKFINKVNVIIDQNKFLFSRSKRSNLTCARKSNNGRCRNFRSQ